MDPGKVYNYFGEGTTTISREIVPRKINPQKQFNFFESGGGVPNYDSQGPLEAFRDVATCIF